jgi:hypothetical protein
LEPRAARWKQYAPAALVASFFLIGFALRMETTRSPSIVFPDEIFQTVEPAHRLAFGYGTVTWEWRDGIRSWVFPAFLSLPMRAAAWLGSSSSAYLTAIAAILSLGSLGVIWFAYAWTLRARGRTAAVVAAGSAAIWYQLVIFAPRALSEVAATNFLLPGLYLGYYGDRFEERKRMFLAGLCCGVAVALRVHLGPAVLIAAVYFAHRQWRRRGLPLAAGLAIPVLAFGLVDALTWSRPFQSFYLNFWENIVDRRAELFGVVPWHWYAIVLMQMLGLMLAFALAGVRRSPFLGWIALTILATHSVVPHKELRFIYPMLPMAITLAALGLVESADWIGRKWKVALPPAGVVAACLGFCAFQSWLFAPQFPYWSKDSGTLAAFDRLSRESGLCGVALYGAPWVEGSYAHLHRNVPILLVQRESDLGRLSSSFNAMVRAGREPLRGYRLAGCRGGICLYRRAGGCDPTPPEYELNNALRLSGN